MRDDVSSRPKLVRTIPLNTEPLAGLRLTRSIAQTHPLRIGMVPAESALGPQALSLMAHTILLADDDVSVRETLARVLELERYAVLLAGTGREAVAKLLSHSPDLVLLDPVMPDQNGWQAFEAIRGAAPLVPIIIITAIPHQSKRAAQLGAAALMEKPPHLPRLLQVLDELLAKSAGAQRVRTSGSHAGVPTFPAWPQPQPTCRGGTC